MLDTRSWIPAWTVLFSMLAGSGAEAQDPSSHAFSRSLAENQFAPVPGIPSCSTAAVQSGDPTRGPSILLAKAEGGCVIPWHWHSPTEHLLMVSGVASIESRAGEPITLRAGGYARMAPKHVHRFVCSEACLFFVHSDGAFDTHYVDESGGEITLEKALELGRASSR